MEKRDAFIRGLELIFERDPSLKPSRVAIDAGLDNSTIRKLLSGNSASPKIETAERIAQQLNMPLSRIIALGEHGDIPAILEIAERIARLPMEAQRQIAGYIEVQLQQPAHAEEEDHAAHPAGMD